MFTGIVESIGTVQNIAHEGSNRTFTIASSLAPHLKIDQSLAHNGVCLTVIETTEKSYKVTAIAETLAKTHLQTWTQGSLINLERAMQAHSRLDGHFVQGHVDCTALCTSREEENGSWRFRFGFKPQEGFFVVEKGSIAVNGVSLTVVNAEEAAFAVAIIPYTFAHTNFKTIEVGTVVNLEFDMLGKYLQASLKNLLPALLKTIKI